LFYLSNTNPLFPFDFVYDVVVVVLDRLRVKIVVMEDDD
jgi:hypothetical protein